MKNKFFGLRVMSWSTVVILFAVVSVIFLTVNYNTVNEEDVVIYKEFSETETSGTDGHIRTTINYYVATDKGIFSIEHGGLLGDTKFGDLEAKHTYHIQTRGIRCNLLKMYPLIVSHKLVTNSDD